MAHRWSRPPERDESGRLAPEVLARARRRVRRSLLALILVIIAVGLLAYACSTTKQRNQRANDHGERRFNRPLTMIIGALIMQRPDYAFHVASKQHAPGSLPSALRRPMD